MKAQFAMCAKSYVWAWCNAREAFGDLAKAMARQVIEDAVRELNAAAEDCDVNDIAYILRPYEQAAPSAYTELWQRGGERIKAALLVNAL